MRKVFALVLILAFVALIALGGLWWLAIVKRWLL